ncbi:diaminopimelate epimerase [Enteractinococcus helveticum]|uniref:Diaminopimelate epimerase n=1 Tax=Enteractinococcus helveticum TaxID=1837282 RepID=A0A1B7LUX3_9MICC|nr:hypothetical protein [Enteractinococcus helveticum]OAV51519.1 hypothetical protein A6F49_01850 [Enteractinococcus helveticum]
MNVSQSTPQVRRQGMREDLAGEQFIKITGPTGDWIVIDEPTQRFELTSEHIVWLCNRSTGVGAVGVVLVTTAPPLHGHPTLRLEAWMADGTPMQHLTEAARVATYALAAWEKIANADTSHHVFSSSSGIITTVYTPAYVGVDIGQWSYEVPETASAAGSDALVMAAGLTDPRPGLSIRAQNLHVTVAVESLEELEGIDLVQAPSIEPEAPEPTGVNFVVPHDPLVVEGIGQLVLRHHQAGHGICDLATAAASATIAFQLWTGLTQLSLWNVSTPCGDIVVQLHEGQRISTFATLSTAFVGRL